MNVEFRLPNIGEGVEAADVAELLVKEGDTITKDQAVAELETEKAVMEVQCPHPGVIRKVHIAEGESIKVGQLLLTIDAAATAGSESTGKPPAPQAAAAQQSVAAAPARPALPSAAAEPSSKPAATADSAGRSAAARTFEFELPGLGEGVEKADVAGVLVQVGDVIAANQAVLELETEKAVMEVPCPEAGRIEAVLVRPGDVVKVGQPVLRLQATGTAAAAPDTPPRQSAGSAGSRQERTPAASVEPPPARTGGSAAVPATRAVTPAELVNGTAGGGDQTPVPAAPSTRRLARKLGVELRQVRGTGAGGRVTQEDVEDHVKNLLARQTLPAVSRGGGGRTLAAGSLAPPPLPDFSRYGLVEREALGKIARTAAENLTVSWNVIPHVTQHDRADITDLEAARKRFGAGVGKNGPKVTMTAVAMKALTTCLQAYPKFNSSLDPETNEIVYKRYYNIGCAVDTPHGLLVPVVKDCDKKSILDIAANITELATKARDRKLSMDDMQGATCTVTNLGGIGGTAFTPIVNYPEVCILGMARSQMELQMIEGQIRERMLLPLALSYDHRVINGADAARFVATLCQLLSDPFQLLSAI